MKLCQASFTYDEPGLQQLLVRRLTDRSEFVCVVVVDNAMFQKGKARYQAPRLRELQRCGAKIFLCKGIGPRGQFHWKDYIIDGKILYHGSCNMTYSSLNDDNFMVRLTGPVVKAALDGLRRARDRCVADSV
jgi:phosphatidylserine/phosphatidylglycerophosphate/cardiolipin synthase-like enzyme